jgi:hypothetical protein
MIWALVFLATALPFVAGLTLGRIVWSGRRRGLPSYRDRLSHSQFLLERQVELTKQADTDADSAHAELVLRETSLRREMADLSHDFAELARKKGETQIVERLIQASAPPTNTKLDRMVQRNLDRLAIEKAHRS